MYTIYAQSPRSVLPLIPFTTNQQIINNIIFTTCYVKSHTNRRVITGDKDNNVVLMIFTESIFTNSRYKFFWSSKDRVLSKSDKEFGKYLRHSFTLLNKYGFTSCIIPKFTIKQKIAVNTCCCIELSAHRRKVYRKCHNIFRFPSNAWFYSIDFHESHHCLEKPHAKCSFRIPCKLRNTCGIYGYEITYALQ